MLLSVIAVSSASAESLPPWNASGNATRHDYLALPEPVEGAAASSERPSDWLGSASERLEVLMKQVSNQTDLMLRLVAVATESTAAMDTRVEALLVLQELIEDLDKAHDFKRLPGGYDALIALLAEPSLQEAAAWAVGTAAQNQRELQLHLLELKALPALLSVVRSASVEARAKALYAAAGMLRNNPDAQWAFVQADGLEDLLAAVVETDAPRLARKVLVLLGDLAHEHLAAAAAQQVGRATYDGHLHAARPPQPLWQGPRWRGRQLCEVVVRCLAMLEVDVQEKALLALKHLHAAGLVDDDEGGGGRGECRGKQLPGAVRRVVEQCSAPTDEAPTGGGTRPSTEQCLDLLPLAKQLERQLAANVAPLPRTVVSDTVFHLEL